MATDGYPWKEPKNPVKRGAFIVVEGLDRAGKTTQVKKLCDELYGSGRNVKTLRFPGQYPPNFIPVQVGSFKFGDPILTGIKIECLPSGR
jgi:hypothetical protein